MKNLVQNQNLREFFTPPKVQILFFIFILLPLIINTLSPIELFVIIFLELFSFLPIIYKKQKKYSYLLWATQIFVFLHFIILFHFDTTFQVQEPSTILIGCFVGITIITQVMVSLYILFQERVIKNILFSLASSTALIVLLIVAFIAIEAAPAFQENDPIEFITGTHFNPFYEYTKQYTVDITTIIEPYNISISCGSDPLYIMPQTTEKIGIDIINTGAQENNVSFEVVSPGISASFDQTNMHIPAHTTVSTNLSVTISNVGTYTITISAFSHSNKQEYVKEITCIATPHAFEMNPPTHLLRAQEYAQNLLGDFTLTNKGETNDTYTVTIQATDEFRPYISGDAWDFSTMSATYMLQPKQNITFTVQANLVQLIPGAHSFFIYAESQNNPSLKKTSTFTVTYQQQTTLTVVNDTKKILQNQTAIYEIHLKRGATDTLGLFINEITPGWMPVLYHLNESIILENYGTANITLQESTYTIYLSITPINQQNDSRGYFTLGVIDWGTQPSFGILTFIIGTILTTLIAVMIAAPLGIGCAILLGEYLPENIRRILRPIYELLAGIPSVIYGLWGFMTLGPFLKQNIYPLITGTIGKYIPIFSETSYIGGDIFTASVVLSIMIVPIVITISEDSIRSVRQDLKEGSLAVGATKWQTLTNIVLPQAKSGITSSIILGTGRAIGETMAVLMIMGLAVRIPTSIFDSTSTMTGVIANTFGWAFDDPLTRHALFAIAMVLFFMVFCLNVIIFRIQRPKKLDKSKKQKYTMSYIFKKIKSGFFYFTKKNKDSIIKEEELENESELQGKIKQDNKISLFKSSIKPNKYGFLKEKIGLIFIIFCAIFVSIFLFYILGDIITKGAPAMRLEYFTETERMAGLEGGFLNAIIGSLYLVGVALIVAAPLSIGAAIYINEYSKKSNILTKIILFASDTLASTPSIVFGAFGFMFFVLTIGFRWSLLAGGLTLGIMIIPLMLRSSLESVKTVSDDLREGSFALSATKWQTIIHIVIPTAIVGIISGVIISIGRAIGETAAVLLTAGYAMEIPTSPLHQVASLPNMIYNYFEFATKNPFLMDKVYAVAFVLIIIVLLLNTIARIIGYRYSRMMKN